MKRKAEDEVSQFKKHKLTTLLEVPDELLAKIFTYLQPQELLSLTSVSTKFNQLVFHQEYDELLWKPIIRRKFNYYEDIENYSVVYNKINKQKMDKLKQFQDSNPNKEVCVEFKYIRHPFFESFDRRIQRQRGKKIISPTTFKHVAVRINEEKLAHESTWIIGLDYTGYTFMDELHKNLSTTKEGEYYRIIPDNKSKGSGNCGIFIETDASTISSTMNFIGMNSLPSSENDFDRKNVGKSKFGGHPDFPKDSAWPSANDDPMKFVCQINLGELSFYKKYQYLPSEGMLYFWSHGENYDNESPIIQTIFFLSSDEIKKKGGLIPLFDPNGKMKYSGSGEYSFSESCEIDFQFSTTDTLFGEDPDDACGVENAKGILLLRPIDYPPYDDICRYLQYMASEEDLIEQRFENWILEFNED